MAAHKATRANAHVSRVNTAISEGIAEIESVTTVKQVQEYALAELLEKRHILRSCDWICHKADLSTGSTGDWVWVSPETQSRQSIELTSSEWSYQAV